MHNLHLLTKLLAISALFYQLSLAQGEGNSQVLFSGEEHLRHELFNNLQPIHRIPPDRGEGFDPWNLSSFANTTFHNTYHPLFEINEYMEHLAALYPSNISISELGHSGEGREMYAMRISSGTSGSDGGQKKGFVISGAQHAREWVASASALHLAHALVANSSEPNSLSHLLNEFDFYILPIPNPDGYVYTWESDRLWYKNRMPLGPNELCRGLDMNRNWGYRWSASDNSVSNELSDSEDDSESEATYFESVLTSITKTKKGKKGKKPKKPKKGRPVPADPCSHWYPGHRPFEAPEVNNIANFIMQLPNLRAFVDLRSYGQMLSWPYAYACDVLPVDAEDLYEAALGAAYAIRKKHGTVYTTGSLCSALYPAPGNILDWMYASAGVKYSYAVHLRDTGTFGYSLPPEWIRPVGEETGALVEYIANFIVTPRK